MILMDIKMDNICAFHDFHCNFSYPRKISKNAIDEEYLKDVPSFRYKKLNVIMGPNASGKTTFGHALLNIFNFIFNKNPVYLLTRISDVTKKSMFEVELVSKGKDEKYYFIKYHVEIPENTTVDNIYKAYSGYYDFMEIRKNDTYETCSRKINARLHKNMHEFLSSVEPINYGWYFSFQDSSDKERLDVDEEMSNRYLKVLKSIISSLDPSVVDVRLADSKVKNTIVIEIPNHPQVISLTDKYPDNTFLSSGTKSGLAIAEMVANILEHRCGFYYCDERFAYVQTDVEKAILSTMVSALGDCEQLFFTTHNSDILDMYLPKHSFTFLRKNVNNPQNIEACTASDYINKCDQSLRNAVENDLFRTVPSVENIYTLLEENNA